MPNITQSSFARINTALLLVCLLLQNSTNAQPFNKRGNSFHTPGGKLDTVVDLQGHKYSLSEIDINKQIKEAGSGGSSAITVASCSSGYFQMYLETGCGMEGTDAASVARLNVLCQVLTDISGFINSPCATTGQKINIWVRSTTSMGAVGFAGLASSFHNAPSSNTVSGIIDNTMWITAISGIDAYKGLASPVTTAGGGTYGYGATYYHGLMAFNVDGSVNWHTNLSTPPGVGETDLYSVVFHEVMHALGFASMINYDATSRLGAGFNYYSRYDRHLQTQSGASLITTSSSSCDLYNVQFNTSLTPSAILSPGSTASTCPTGYQTGSYVNHSTCTSTVKYVGATTQPVYTPYCYEKGSSLSHFEDECSVPAGFSLTPPASNDHYFVMSNQSVAGPYSATTNPGAMKRSLTPEERLVLCDLGYKTNTTFGSTTTLNYRNYGGSTCPGIQVAGFSDGIDMTDGSYVFFTNVTTPIVINGGTAGSLLGNDFGATSFKCLEVVSGLGVGTVLPTSGGSSTVVTYTPDTGSYGVQLLRYIPVSASGQEGNITYVYVYLGDNSCVPNACDLVPNGSFENSSTTEAGDINMYPYLLHCWHSYTNSPDLYTRGVPGINGIPSMITSPMSDTHNITPDNNHWMGIYGQRYGTMTGGESGQALLTSGLIPGKEYLISFWAMQSNTTPYTLLDNHVEFAVSPGHTPLAPMPHFEAALPAGLTSLYSFVVPGDTKWRHFSRKVKYTGTTVGNVLVIIVATYSNPVTHPTEYYTYVSLDDVSIQPIDGTCTFSLPEAICDSATPPIVDLDTVVTVPGGTFTWQTLPVTAGVPTISHSSVFNVFDALSASYAMGHGGLIELSYDYTSALGCAQTAFTQIAFVDTIPGITGPDTVMGGATITLDNMYANGKWTTSNPLKAVISNAGVLTGVSSGTVIVTYSFAGGCTATKVITILHSVGVADMQSEDKRIAVLPNPNKGVFSIEGQMPGAAGSVAASIEVMDIMGKVVKEVMTTVNNGKVSYKLNLGDAVPRGMYFVKIKTTDWTEVIRFVLE